MLTEEEKKRLAQRMVVEVWGQGKVGVVDEIVGEDYVEYMVNHSLEIRGRKDLKDLIKAFHEVIPKFVKYIENTTVSNEAVIVHYSEMRSNIDPNARIQGVVIYGFSNGKIVEGIDIRNSYDIIRDSIFTRVAEE
ncbi:MAG: ester cyclase [Halobacteria archaeon]|nr:ester cyclase [Halobacteria archaeon]